MDAIIEPLFLTCMELLKHELNQPQSSSRNNLFYMLNKLIIFKQLQNVITDEIRQILFYERIRIFPISYSHFCQHLPAALQLFTHDNQLESATLLTDAKNISINDLILDRVTTIATLEASSNLTQTAAALAPGAPDGATKPQLFFHRLALISNQLAKTKPKRAFVACANGCCKRVLLQHLPNTNRPSMLQTTAAPYYKALSTTGKQTTLHFCTSACEKSWHAARQRMATMLTPPSPPATLNDAIARNAHVQTQIQKLVKKKAKLRHFTSTQLNEDLNNLVLHANVETLVIHAAEIIRRMPTATHPENLPRKTAGWQLEFNNAAAIKRTNKLLQILPTSDLILDLLKPPSVMRQLPAYATSLFL